MQADPNVSKEQYSNDDEQDTQKLRTAPSRRITSTLERDVPTIEDATGPEDRASGHIEDHETAILASTHSIADREAIDTLSDEQNAENDELPGDAEEAVESLPAFDLKQTERTFLEAIETSKLLSIHTSATAQPFDAAQPFATTTTTDTTDTADAADAADTINTVEAIDTIDTIVAIEVPRTPTIAELAEDTSIAGLPTVNVPTVHEPIAVPRTPNLLELAESRPAVVSRATRTSQKQGVQRGGILLMIALLFVVVLHAITLGQGQFLGPQGWAYVLGGPTNTNDPNLLKNINNTVTHKATPGATAQTVPMTPQQYIDLIVQRMTLDQKLGQMLIVQFTGPAYSLDLSTMISQYGVGAVLIFSANQNIHDKVQLTGLLQQMQHNSTVPLAVAIDQEGGYVDRLVSLDGPRPAEATIGASNDPNKAKAAGIQDAKDLASYGFNLNLAPVVDVTNVYNPQLYTRTYGNTPDLVTKMAMAYVQGLQQSGKVLGTLKHFPGLGDVGVDPHLGVPHLNRSLSDLERIDWSPYRTLIQQGNIHAIMVTHEIVEAVDSSVPSSLSYKVVTGILRQKLGFQGVIMTDSLTMDSITAYYTEAQAAAVAVEAGSDLLMGAATPSDVAAMIQGIKQAMSSGEISQQRIDDSVRRILMMKYAMGLLPIPNN